MTTLTVNIDDDRDLPAVQAFLDSSGITYSVELDDEELEASLKRASEDSAAGRIRPHAEVWAGIRARYKI